MPARADDNPRTPISPRVDSGVARFLRNQNHTGPDGTIVQCDGDGSEAPIKSGERRSTGWRIRQSSIAMPTSQHLPSFLSCCCIGDSLKTNNPSFGPGWKSIRWQSQETGKHVWSAAGKTAVMVFEGEFIRMTLPVMCLQSGGQGQRVRVINRETKKTYLGAGNRM